MQVSNKMIYEKLQEHEKILALLVERGGQCEAKHKAIKNDVKLWVFGGLLATIILILGWVIK